MNEEDGEAWGVAEGEQITKGVLGKGCGGGTEKQKKWCVGSEQRRKGELGRGCG